MSLFENPEIYRMVLESMQTGIYLVDRDQRIQFWNAGAEQITGYLRQDVVGHFCRDFFPPQSEEGKDGVCEIGGALAGVLRDGQPTIAELTLRHRAGHQVLVRVRAVPIRDGHGTVIGAAESIDADPWAFDANRRETKLANYGCLDEETGVLSFGYIHTHLRENLITFAEHRMPFSLLCVQIDSMDHFRAAYGAAAVSAVMRVVAQTVESSLRPTDFVGHLAENEFLAILTECNEKELSKSAERLRKTVSNTKFKWWGDDLPVSASFGGATVKEGDDENSVVKRAEKSLEASVKSGGNRVTVAQ